MITHPEKILFPDCGVSKAELCAYYEAVAPVMLPHIAGRPITMERYPAGIEKKGFIQKDVAKGFPASLQRWDERRRADDAPLHYALAHSADDLVWMANQNSITPHVWTSRAPETDLPDLCLFDLDPSEDQPRALRAAALAVRELLTELALSSFVKTSGSKGFHIAVPLDRRASFHDVLRFAHAVGLVLVKRHPELFTQEFIKADREDKILIDTGRNVRGATFAAPYAVRAKPTAPVSAPCTWPEVESGAALPRAFTLRSMSARLEQQGDLWKDLAQSACSLTEPLRQLETLFSPDEWQEALAATTRRPRSRKRAKKS